MSKKQWKCLGEISLRGIPFLNFLDPCEALLTYRYINENYEHSIDDTKFPKTATMVKNEIVEKFPQLNVDLEEVRKALFLLNHDNPFPRHLKDENGKYTQGNYYLRVKRKTTGMRLFLSR